MAALPAVIHLVGNGRGRRVELAALPPHPSLEDVRAAVAALLEPGSWVELESDDVEPCMELLTLERGPGTFHRFFVALTEPGQAAGPHGGAAADPRLLQVRQSPLLTHRPPPSRVPAAPYLLGVGALRAWAWTPGHHEIRVEHSTCPGPGLTQLPVGPGSTVGGIKKQLAAVVGLPPERQLLVAHNPRESVDVAEREVILWEDGATLSQLGITPAWWLEVQPGPLELSMPLSVVLPSGKYENVRAAASMKVCHLKALLGPLCDLPPRGMRLTLRGRTLRDLDPLGKHLQRGDSVALMPLNNLCGYKGGQPSREALQLAQALPELAAAMTQARHRRVEVVHPDGATDLAFCPGHTTVQQLKQALQQHWASGQAASQQGGVFCASAEALQAQHARQAQHTSAAAAAPAGTASGAAADVQAAAPAQQAAVEAGGEDDEGEEGSERLWPPKGNATGRPASAVSLDLITGLPFDPSASLPVTAASSSSSSGSGSSDGSGSSSSSPQGTVTHRWVHSDSGLGQRDTAMHSPADSEEQDKREHAAHADSRLDQHAESADQASAPAAGGLAAAAAGPAPAPAAGGLAAASAVLAQQLGGMAASTAAAVAAGTPPDPAALQASLRAMQELMAALVPGMQACSSLLASAAAAVAAHPPAPPPARADAACQVGGSAANAATAAGTQTDGDSRAELAASSSGVQTGARAVADAAAQTERLPPDMAELVAKECAHCGRSARDSLPASGQPVRLMKCACAAVYYCSTSCQQRDWGASHKRYCALLRRALGR